MKIRQADFWRKEGKSLSPGFSQTTVFTAPHSPKGQVNKLPFPLKSPYKAAKPFSRSAIMSSMCSVPIERRIVFCPIP